MSPISRRGTAGHQPTGGSNDDRKRLISAAGLLLTVLVILLVGAFLQTDSVDRPPGETVRSGETVEGRVADEELEEPGVTSTETRPRARTGGTTATAPASEGSAAGAADLPTSPTVSSDLDGRARSDVSRLGSEASGWTLQLLVSCERDNASRLLRLSGESRQLFLLPIALGGQPCFRLCWGRYATRELALRANGMPSALRSELDLSQAQARAVTDVLP